MKIHYLNRKDEEVFIDNVVHLQNIDDNLFEALLTNGRNLILPVYRIEGIADMALLENKPQETNIEKQELKEFANDIHEVQGKVGKQLVEETKCYLKQVSRYNSKIDFKLAHPKSADELQAEELNRLGYRKQSEVAKEMLNLFEKKYEILKDLDTPTYIEMRGFVIEFFGGRKKDGEIVF